MSEHTPNGTVELVECLDVLMAALDYEQERREHTERIVAFYEHYGNEGVVEDDGLAGDEWAELEDEYEAQFETLVDLSPMADFDQDEYETALWQSASLAMTLLFDHMQLIDQVMGQTEPHLHLPPNAADGLIVP